MHFHDDVESQMSLEIIDYLVWVIYQWKFRAKRVLIANRRMFYFMLALMQLGIIIGSS